MAMSKKPISVIPKKRAAKRIASKTLEKMRQRTSAKKLLAETEKARQLEINKQLKLKEYREKQHENKLYEQKYGKYLNNLRKKKQAKIADKERFSPQTKLSEAERSKQMRNVTLERIDAQKKRIETIENAYKHLEYQRLYVPENNSPQKGMLIRFLTEAKTKEQWAKRGYQEGHVVTEKQYKDTIRRNRLAYNTAINELNRMEFLYSLKKQERWLSDRNMGEYKEAHASAINTLTKEYDRGRISGEVLKRYMSVLDSSVKRTIEQNRVLAKTKGTEFFDLHAKVAGKALLSFLKESNIKNLDKSIKRFSLKMSAIEGTINKPNRSMELEWLYKNL